MMNTTHFYEACPAGYEDFRGRVCYFIGAEEYTWSEAQDWCHSIGGYLLEVDNKEEQAHVSNLIEAGKLSL